MACAKCQAHRQAIVRAARTGSIKATGAESAAALRTLNEKMVARFLGRKRSK